MFKTILILALILPMIFIAASMAHAQDENQTFNSVHSGNQPQVYVNDLYLEPQANLAEESQGGVGPILWSAGLKTRFASWVDAQISIGAPQLLFRPSWSAAPTEPVNLVDGIITLHSYIGDFYAGQFMVPWGLEGQTLERDLWLPRTLFYQLGSFPLRDVGVGFRTEVDGIYMNLAVHNGEGAELSDTDQRMFLTGEWGYKGPANMNFGVSITAGRVGVPEVTSEELIRGGNAFFGFNIFGLGLQIEASALQEITALGENDILAWHGDVEHPLSDHINLIARYEQYNPNTRVNTSNILGRAYLGGEYHSQDNVSRLFLFAVEGNESVQEVPNNEILVSWRLTPGVE